MHEAMLRLNGECERLKGCSRVIISTSVQTRQNGWPRSGARDPEDPGAAVYFFLDDRPRVLACDRWTRVADNLVAIAKHIEALRGIDRWGVGTMEQAFGGYRALPPAAEEWWLILGISADATREEVDDAYKRLLKTAHPDVGGDTNTMSRLNVARDAAHAAG